jgi:hypothetical protein
MSRMTPMTRPLPVVISVHALANRAGSSPFVMAPTRMACRPAAITAPLEKCGITSQEPDVVSADAPMKIER